ncbi:MAG: DUF378 domain-containing protein [Clostridia bacterium]|nr:DUF378 domain-containing protein [Clostridia bacterium]
MFDKICLILLIIGGLNWGSIGLFQFDLVAWAFGGQDALFSRIVYTLVALSAVWCISLLFRDNTEAGDSNDMDMPMTSGSH